MGLFNKKKAQQSVGGGASPSEFLGGALGELSCNSPSGPLKLGGKKSRGISKGKKGSMLAVAAPSPSQNRNLFSPGAVSVGGAAEASQYTSNKIVMVRKPDAPGATIGVKFYKHEGIPGILVGSLETNSAADRSGLVVGDVVYQIDGKDVQSCAEAAWIVNEAAAGASLFFQVSGGTRVVTLDKRMGDCGMTCAAAHIPRGVLLKRIQEGSLAAQAQLFPGDTLLSVNNVLVHHHAEAVAQIDACQAEVKLVMLGESMEVTVPPPQSGSFVDERLGLVLRDHDSPLDGAGVRVEHVELGGRCARAGVTTGDLLLAVNSVLCTDHAQAMGLIKQVQDMATNPFADPTAQSAELKLVIQSKYSGRH